MTTATSTLVVDERRDCATCGRSVHLKLPAGAPEWLIRAAQAQVDGRVPVECAKCTKDREAAEKATDRAEHRARLIERRMVNSGIPEKWQAARFDELERDAARLDAIVAAEQWGSAQRRGLLLTGKVGRGKSQFAGAAAMARLNHGSVRWLSVAELLMKLRMPFSSPEYARAVRALEAKDKRVALVLDDLNKLKPTDTSVQPLYVAINGWVEAQQPLLVTMNGTLDDLAADFGERFGEPIASRLAEHCKVVEVGGRDPRTDP